MFCFSHCRNSKQNNWSFTFTIISHPPNHLISVLHSAVSSSFFTCNVSLPCNTKPPSWSAARSIALHFVPIKTELSLTVRKTARHLQHTLTKVSVTQSQRMQQGMTVIKSICQFVNLYYEWKWQGRTGLSRLVPSSDTLYSTEPNRTRQLKKRHSPTSTKSAMMITFCSKLKTHFFNLGYNAQCLGILFTSVIMFYMS